MGSAEVVANVGPLGDRGKMCGDEGTRGGASDFAK